MTRHAAPSAPLSGAEMIDAPNPLRRKLGSRFGGVDAAAVAKAEAALNDLAGHFGQWLRDEMDKLDAARAALHAEGASEAGMDRLYLHAHDLKGLGATYGYPLISRIAASLCKLLDAEIERAETPLFLIDAHVHAARAVVRDDIRDSEHPTGRALAQALEMRVADHMAAANGSSTAP